MSATKELIKTAPYSDFYEIRSWVIAFFLIGLFYLIFISIKISFDGRKLIW